MSSGGVDEAEKVLKGKLKELEDIVNPVLSRKAEASKRPEAIKELKDTITHMKEVEDLIDGQIKTQSVESSKSSEAVSRASASPVASPSTDPLDDLEDAEPSASAPVEPEITEVPTVYTESDLATIQDLASKAKKWIEDAEAKQKKLSETDDPAFTIKELEAEKKKLDDAIMDMMMKRMKHFKPPNQKTKAKPKVKPTKKKTEKKTKNDKKAEEATSEHPHPDSQAQMEEMEQGDVKHNSYGGDGPSEEELQEALRKAGVNTDKIKLKNYGHKDEIQDDTGRKLKKLDINKDSTEEEILAALDELTGSAKEKDHDEL